MPDRIIIMYIYHALINALSAHMIHINLNIIFYTHVEHSHTKTIYIKYYKKKIPPKYALQTHTRAHTYTHTHTHTDCSRNWVLILVRMERKRVPDHRPDVSLPKDLSHNSKLSWTPSWDQ